MTLNESDVSLIIRGLNLLKASISRSMNHEVNDSIVRIRQSEIGEIENLISRLNQGEFL